MTNWTIYEQLLAAREKETLEIMTEANKQYRQAKANYESAKRERQAFADGIEERLKGMEQNGIYTAQKDDGSWNTL